MMDNLIYNDGEIELKVSLEKDTVWLSTNDIADIFEVNRPAIVKHIGNIYKTDELPKESTCSILEQVANDGKKRKINFYSLDMIISVGYRVNSKKATKFRQWANQVLKQYIVDGYSVNSSKLTELRLNNLEQMIVNIKEEFINNKLSTNEKIEKINKTIELKKIKPSQGIFYDGQTFDAYVFVADLIKQARTSIKLIDNYIDEKEVYHIGASLKDLGKKWFGFSKMDSESFEMMGRLK